MEAVEQFFRDNMHYVFFVYGLAFVFMGISLSLQPKINEHFKPVKVIWLLSLFALLHGVNEWLDMLLFLHPSNDILKTISFIFLVSSFCFLLEFGRQTLRICESITVRYLSQYLKWWLVPVLLTVIVIVSYNSQATLQSGQILSRYFLAFPGAVFSAIGLRLHCKATYISQKMKLEKYFLITTIFFIVYGILAGLVVPEGDFFPSNILNTNNFLAFVKIPVQVFRAAAAVIIAFSMVGVIRLFNYEAKNMLQETIDELYRKRENIVQNAKLQEVVNSILKVSLLSVSLKRQLEKILEILISIPWLASHKKGCIFLLDERYNRLRIAASHNFSYNQLSTCSSLILGQCLCGLAASSGDIVFSSDSTDERHTIMYNNIELHGHYCVPVILEDRLLGVLTVDLNAGHTRNSNEEVFLKTVANTIAGIIVRKESEERIADSALAQGVMNLILNVSLELIPLKEKLQKILDILSNVPWISESSSMGCIFLIEDNPDMLVMKAHRRVPLKLFETCTNIPLGKCLCGTAAQTGKTIFKSSVDNEHEIQYDALYNHGHYCVPIKSKKVVLGVISIYVKEGHTYDKSEETFLLSVADVLAGVVERKAVEDRIERMEILEQSLQESEKKYRQLVELAHEGIWVTDKNFNTTFVNKAMADMLGFTIGEILSRRMFAFMDIPDIETAKKYIEGSRQGLTNHHDFAFIRKDGTKIYTMVSAAAVMDEKGNYDGTIAFLTDITKRKEAEKTLKSSVLERDVLLRELHHRVKNNLQLVSGLIGLQLNYVKDKTYRDMFIESRNRIQSISLIHEKLYHKEGLSEIDFKKYITSLSQDIFIFLGAGKNKLTFKTDIENVYIGLDIAIPCGLIINELFTNILKHAFKDDRDGEIKLVVHTVNNDEIELIISDNGVGLPPETDFSQPKTLGMQIVSVLVKQIDGTIELDRTNGTTFSLRFKKHYNQP
ncbi:MAG: PAS domain S-box protein [Nitrospirae bacterium YQR-1]